MNKKGRMIFLLICLAVFILWQGSGWGKEFRLASPGYSYHFPLDHGSHEDYQVEWWYFTGHLRGQNGIKAGFELTFFRTGIQSDSIRNNPSKWHVENIYSAHFAISNESIHQFWYREKVSRNALGKAGAERDRFQTWIGNWSAGEEQGIFYLNAEDGTGNTLKKIALKLIPEKQAVIHGENGVSPKDKNSTNRSHYYSYTRLKTSGVMVWNGEDAKVEGISWMDHEFGSNPLLPSQTGWDWFSIQLNDQTELMLYQIRNQDNSPPYSFGTIVDKYGHTRTLHSGDFIIKTAGQWLSPAGGTYPMGWEITLLHSNETYLLTPLLLDQELNVFGGQIRYWEGSVEVSGKPISIAGAGYVELTGYGTEMFKTRK